VGNASPYMLTVTSSSVHPHVCGERYIIRGGGEMRFGSSPRVWGTLTRNLILGYFGRFIPTCVGNAYSISDGWALSSVHPHVCGER